MLKAGKLKFPFEAAYAARASEIEDPRADFDISKLPAGIKSTPMCISVRRIFFQSRSKPLGRAERG